jgi:NitT/TauT family transport system substrate-binding protein
VMAAAPTLDRAHQEYMLTEVKRLMTAGKAGSEGLFWVDPDAIKTAHDFFVANKVLSKPVDLKAAYDGSFISAIPAADRKL